MKNLLKLVDGPQRSLYFAFILMLIYASYYPTSGSIKTTLPEEQRFTQTGSRSADNAGRAQHESLRVMARHPG